MFVMFYPNGLMVILSPISYLTVGIQTQQTIPIKSVGSRQSIRKREKRYSMEVPMRERCQADAMRRMSPDAKADGAIFEKDCAMHD